MTLSVSAQSTVETPRPQSLSLHKEERPSDENSDENRETAQKD